MFIYSIIIINTLDVMYIMNGTYCVCIYVHIGFMESKNCSTFWQSNVLLIVFLKWSPLIAKILEVVSLRLN